MSWAIRDGDTNARLTGGLSLQACTVAALEMMERINLADVAA